MVPHEPEKAGGIREEVGWQGRTRPAGGGCGVLSWPAGLIVIVSERIRIGVVLRDRDYG